MIDPQQPGMVSVLTPILALIAAASPAEVRSLRAFTEQEVELPDGPRKGDHWDGNWPRWQGRMLEMMMDPWWSEVWTTGPRQTGKTLLGFEAPLLHALFEMREDVICLVPEMKKASMIWLKKIEPVIRRSRYADQLPKTGAGSRGGSDFDIIVFANGASMHFMGAGGADPPSSATARVVVITGDQGNPINAVKGCTASFGDRARVYGESIITTADCITWRQITEVGTDTRVMLRCPHCGHHQYPERERLVGWKDAPDAIAAAEAARYACLRCDVLWTAADRDQAIDRAQLVHRGQTIDDDGTIHGEAPRTRVLGTRWNAMCHPMRTMADIGAQEWEARKLGTETEEMAMCQYVWATPYVAATRTISITNEGLHAVSQRGRFDKRTVPSWVQEIYAAEDVQGDRHYWLAMGVGPDDRWCIVDWGFEMLITKDDPRRKDNPDPAPTPKDRRRAQDAIDSTFAIGWQMEGQDDDRMSPSAKGKDVAYLTTELLPWLKGRPGWYAMRGVGKDDLKATGDKVDVPEHLQTWVEITKPNGWSTQLIRVNAHNVRTEIHAGLMRDSGAPASGELPRGLKANDFLLLHLSGEVWETPQGKKAYWREVRARHDLLDCAIYALALSRVYRELLQRRPVAVSASQWFGQGRKR
jgi:phage terminase large subunit GpA-like protein